MRTRKHQNWGRLFEALEARMLLSSTATGWSTVDNFAAGSHAEADAIAADKNAAPDPSDADAGGVYAVGWYNTTNASGVTTSRGVVREFLNGSWNTINDYQYNGVATVLDAAAVDASGNLFVAGYAGTGGGTDRWLVLEKPANAADNPSGFQLIDNFQLVAGYESLADAITVAGGNVYIAGSGNAPGATRNSSPSSYWLVRELAAGQTTFGTVDQYLGYSGAGPTGIAAAPADPTNPASAIDVYACGASSGHWIVRASANGGATWSTVDDSQMSTTVPGGNGAYAVAVDPNNGNTAYVAGAARSTTTTKTGKVTSSTYYWIVRQSTQATAAGTWSTIVHLQSPYGQGPSAIGIVQSSGQQYVYTAGGMATSATSQDYGATVASVFQNGAWTSQVVDQFQLAAGQSTYYYGFAQGPDGTLYTAGYADDANGTSHWIVRDPPPPSGSTGGAATAFSSVPISSGDSDGSFGHRHRQHGR